MANHPAVLESSGLLSEAQLAELGWHLKPEGLCQDDTCVLVPDRSALVHDEGVDVAVLADLLDRPVVVDSTAGLVALGSPRAARRQALRELTAPDFSLPNLDGGVTSLSDHRSKKRLLIAFSSW